MIPTVEKLPIHKYGTVVCLGVVEGIRAVAPLAKDLKTVGNRVVSILGANVESDLVGEQDIRDASDEVIISVLDGSRGDPRHVGHFLLERLSVGDVKLVVAIGPVEEVERIGATVQMVGCAFVVLAPKY